ncbi:MULTISPECIES: hypothetical protein [Cupriavidus]
MAQRVKPQRGQIDLQRVFHEIRAKIAERLQAPDLTVQRVSPEELAIGTFVPSWLTEGARISDYPFIGARYVSLVTGEVFIVVGSHPDEKAVIAREVGFWRSFLHDGQRVVAISVNGWLDNVMHVYSTNQISFGMQGNELAHIDGEVITRRSYPGRKFTAYLRYLSDQHWLWQRARALRARVAAVWTRRTPPAAPSA